MIALLKKLHLYALYKGICMFFINRVFVTNHSISCKIKRQLLRSLGYSIGKNTTIVSPVHIFGSVDIGNNSWINKGFTVHGNGCVKIGNNCDIAPDVTFLTGGHVIAGPDRRAGKGEVYNIVVEDGCWIGARATIAKNINVGKSSVVAACSCVVKNIQDNTLVAGVPAKPIRNLDDEQN